MVYPDFDACTAFGNAFNGGWFVYFLVIPAQNQTFTTVEALLNYLETNDVPYRLQWYGLDVKCGGAQ